MSVSNGQLCNETVLNAAFVSKTSDSSVAANLELADADATNGSTITQVQRELNSISSFTGHVINTAKDVKPTWATNNVGASTDSLLERAEAFDVEFDNVSTLIGTAIGDTDLGTFSGSTITDNSSIKSALQELETAVESASTFDGLAPTTTKGDLVAHNGSTNVRVAVGTNGTFLKADSSASAGVTWASAAGVLSVRSVTTTDTCTNADDILVLSGSSFTQTLFTAVGNTGKILELIHNGTSLTQAYTLNTTGGQTIGGIASGSYVMHTNGEKLKIVSDGTNWLILDHYAVTSWIDAGAITITATTTNPTKPSGITVDKVYWRRNGSDAIIRYEYRQSNTTGAAAGSGDYLFGLPVTMDTSVLSLETNVEGVSVYDAKAALGTFSTRASSTNNMTGIVAPYDSTKVTFRGISSGGSTGAVSSSFSPVTADAAQHYAAIFTVPVSGWRP